MNIYFDPFIHLLISSYKKMPPFTDTEYRAYPQQQFFDTTQITSDFGKLCVECNPNKKETSGNTVYFNSKSTTDDDFSKYIEEKITILRKQTRLLMIREATLCMEAGRRGKQRRCNSNKQCNKYKKLCQHILECRSDNCKYPGCLSTRQIISHHRECRDRKCLVCIPVKNAVKQMKKKERVERIRQRESLKLSRTLDIICEDENMYR